jgi:polyisoprenoid-binding protein YceI
MTKLTTTLVIAIAAVGLSLGGCKKKDQDAPATGSNPPPVAAVDAAAAAPAVDAPAAVPVPVEADSFKVTASHVDPAKGNVDVVFGKLTVKAAKFDVKNLEGGTADIEVDVTSLSTGIGDRDKHLQTPDYLDAIKFPVITIKVDNVKSVSDTSYTADTTVNAHGVEKKIPVKFDVTASTADSVTVHVTHTFSRKDFGVGGPGDAKDPVKFDLVLDAVLTLKNM